MKIKDADKRYHNKIGIASSVYSVFNKWDKPVKKGAPSYRQLRTALVTSPSFFDELSPISRPNQKIAQSKGRQPKVRVPSTQRHSNRHL